MLKSWSLISPHQGLALLMPTREPPGVSVLDAYTGADGPTGLTFDTRRVAFNSESGTSMSCSHISSVAGLLKTLHPDWSPSAIKSAIMITARTQDNMGKPILNASYVKATPFSYGFGHVQPNHAMDLGLVYDLTTNNYLNFLCALGYNSIKMANFNGGSYSCPFEPQKFEDLNYPSITIPNLSGSITVIRTLKNVGSPGTYIVCVRKPRGISVSVNPKSLTFDKMGEEKKFEVVLEVNKGHILTNYVFGRLIWSDGKHFVRTLVVKAVGLKP